MFYSPVNPGRFNSVCVTALIRKREVYILDAFRARLQFPDLKRRAIELAIRWESDVLLIEDAASGQQLIQILKHESPKGVPRPIACKPEGDKHSRFSAQTHRIEAGELVLPRDAIWLGEFERELLGFPSLKHDDQVDALTQLLAWRTKSGNRPYIAWDIPGIEGPRLILGESE